MNYTELVEKAKQKDEKAIEELFELTSQKGYYVALKYLKNKEDAQDILQDAYVSSLTKLDQLKDPSKYDKWLFQMIANKAKNYLVKNKPLLFEQLDSDDEEDIQFEETITDDRIEFQPKENTDYQELKHALKNLIDELPEDQRMCLLMYYFEELSINEIAESLELNNNTIKSRLNYARKRIKEKVEELQKQGTHLFGVAPIPFLVWMLLQEEQAVAVPQISTHLLLSQATQEAGKEVAKQGIRIFGKTISTKAFVSTSISVLLFIAGGYGYYQYSEEQKKKDIYNDLSIEFSDKLIYEYGNEFNESELILNHTGHLKALNSLDVKKTGNQTLKYTVSKDGIERNFEISVEIKDTKKPILTLTQESLELSVNDKFEPLQYIKEAYDEIDGDLKQGVVIDNPVDVKKSGEYEVKYSLIDNNGLGTETILKVIVKQNSKPANTKPANSKPSNNDNKTVVKTDDRLSVNLKHLGLNMKLPSSFQYTGPATIGMSDSIGGESFQYLANIGSEGLVMDIYYFPYGDEFENMEGSQGLRMRTIDKYTGDSSFQRYNAYDKGSYILAYKQGIDYPVSGTAWSGENDNESISIRIEGKSDDSGVYAINMHVNNYNRGYSLGGDGFKEKRIEIAKEIFNSIK